MRLSVTLTGTPNQWLYRRCYDYHQGTGSGYDHTQCNPPLSSVGNNGNIYQITNLLDNNRTLGINAQTN
jgi:hypothetical protein